MLNYERLSDEMSARIKTDREKGTAVNFAFDEMNIIRRNNSKDKANIIRTACICDIDKIIHARFIIAMLIKHRYFHSTKMTILPDVDFTFSWYHE